MKLWRCTVCGYEVMAEEPPDICPSCGAPKEAFVEVEDE
jgi:rubrerythrin